MMRTTRLDPGRWDPAGQAAVALGEIAPATPQAGEGGAASGGAAGRGESAPATPGAGGVVGALIPATRGATLDGGRATAAERLRGATLDWRGAMAVGALARFGPDQAAPALPVLLDLLK